MKIILIALDTLRADHLGCYGYQRDTSPTIDGLAEESLFFENAISPISYTQPSIVSVFTSLYPSYHYQQFSNNSTPLYKGGVKTLPDALRGRFKSLRTAAFVGSIVLHSSQVDFSDSFELYNEDFTGHEVNRPESLLRKAKDTTSLALKWLEDNYESNFLLFLHYMDIHGPYVPPFWYRWRYHNDKNWAKPPLCLDKIDTADIYGSSGDLYKQGIFDYQLLRKKVDAKGEIVKYEHNVDYYISQYDANIRYVDDQLKRLIIFLKKRKIYEDTLIVLFSDHGEAFGENNVFFFHGLTVSMEQVRVPLMLKMPGMGRKGYSEPVSLLDVMPTLLDFYGSPEEAGAQGVSLLKEQHDRVVYSQILKQASAINKYGQLLYGKGWLEARGTTNLFASSLGNFRESEISGREVTYLGFNKDDALGNKGLLLASLNDFVAGANAVAERNIVNFKKDEGGENANNEIASRLKDLGYLS